MTTGGKYYYTSFCLKNLRLIYPSLQTTNRVGIEIHFYMDYGGQAHFNNHSIRNKLSFEIFSLITSLKL